MLKMKVEYRCPNKIFAPELGNSELRGEIGTRIDRFVQERITGEFARNEILKEAEIAFRDQYDDESESGKWLGEFWGKLVLSAVRVCRMKQDASLKEYLRKATYSLLRYQREDGYLNTYRDSKKLFRADPEVSMQQVGWPSTHNFNVWCRKYTLWALLEAAQLLEDEFVLNCAERMADQLLNELEELGAGLLDAGIMHGMSAGSILKPLLVLYRLTGKERYYQFALDFVQGWDREDGACPNLIRNGCSGKAPMQWYPEMEEWITKAYEMMSCYDGLCELYRLSGEEKYLNATKGLYEILKKYELNILGSVGYCERFYDGAAHPDSATEVCDVIHWMRLCYELFCLTGEAKYMESFEKAFLNAFLAGMYEDGKSGAFFVRSSGRHWDAHPQCGTKYQHCCLNNVPRGFVNAVEAAIMKSDDGYYINSYLPAWAAFGAVSIKVGGNYLGKGSPSVTFRNLPEGSTVYFRIPEWSRKNAIRYNGEVIEVNEQGYTRFTAKESDFILWLDFDMTPEIVDFAGEFPVLPESDYHVRRWVDEDNGICDRSLMLTHPMSTVRRGPLLLARSKRFGSTEEAMFNGKTVCGKEYSCSAEAIRNDRLLCACRVTFCGEGEEFTYQMCDFASAANRELEDPRYFTVFV